MSVKRCHGGGWALGTMVATLVSVSVSGLVSVSTALGQAEPPPRAHVLLPPAYGATPLSTVIQAEASYIQSVGDYLESAAIARRHHAIAAEHEMRNALKWVETYFERRALNRAYRLKEDPPYLDKEAKRHDQKRRVIVDQSYLSIKGDPTDELNWLLDELSESWLAYKYLPGNRSLADSEFDDELNPDDIRHIRLSDGGKVGGKQLVFRAADANAFEAKWPVALRGQEFDDAREYFETVRDAVAGEVRNSGKLTVDAQNRLMEAVDHLSAEFNRYYTHERRTTSSADFLVYQSGKRFLQSLAGSVYRAVDTGEIYGFDGSYRFKGDSVVDLVDHLYELGLHFVSPEPGDEGVYQKLFYAMRNLYTRLGAQEEGKSGS